MVYCTCLENRSAARHREFESHPLRPGIMKYLGIDYGEKRIGIAVSDDDGRVAFPLTTVAGGKGAAADIGSLVQKEKAGAVVLGESRTLSGEPNPIMETIERFKKDIEALTGLPVIYEREFFTSALAARQFAPEEKSRKKNPSQEKLDAAAAALILQSYLDRKS